MVVFTGCSFTSGVGLDPIDHLSDAKTSPNLWVNQLHSDDKLKHLTLVNISQGGASNADIFQQTVGAISDHGKDIKYIFCQWTSMPRLRFKAGLELWKTELYFPRRGTEKNNLQLTTGEIYTKKYLDDVNNRLMTMIHLHPEIVKLVDYCNCLQKLCKQLDIKIFYINGLCPWDKDYFIRLQNSLPQNYTEFTKTTIINIDTRSDEEIHKLYNQIHNDYDSVGGIDPDQWINLYSSMKNNRIDLAHDNLHPGIKSNQQYTQDILQFLSNNDLS